MTTITINRATVEQALEALKDDQYRLVEVSPNQYEYKTCLLVEVSPNQYEYKTGRLVEVGPNQYEYKTDLAIAALERALAQRAEPVQEPVAWYYERDTDKGLSFAPDRDPYKCWQPLYTAPPQRKPLTVEEAAALIELDPRMLKEFGTAPSGAAMELIRAVERALEEKNRGR